MSTAWAEHKSAIQFSESFTSPLPDFMRAMRESFALRAKARESLYDVAERCKRNDWDGEGAIAISQNTYQKAYIFLDALPIHLPSPEFIPEPDGLIAMEWYSGPGRLIVITVGDTCDLHYSCTLGNKRWNGREFFQGHLPDRIQGLIELVISSR